MVHVVMTMVHGVAVHTAVRIPIVLRMEILLYASMIRVLLVYVLMVHELMVYVLMVRGSMVHVLLVYVLMMRVLMDLYVRE